MTLALYRIHPAIGIFIVSDGIIPTNDKKAPEGLADIEGDQEAYKALAPTNDPEFGKEHTQQAETSNVVYCQGKFEPKVTKYFEPLTIQGNFNPAAIPVRDFIIDKYLLKKYVNVWLSPGGVGKSTFALAEAISVATGRDLLGLGINRQAKTLIINNEDDTDEIYRRVMGICAKHDIPLSELEGNFYFFSGYDNPFKVACKAQDGTIIATPNVKGLIDWVQAKGIEVITIDPFISTHNATENANDEIDKVTQQYKTIAAKTGAAVRIIHHTRKNGKDSESHAGDVESGRGAKSLTDASRVVHTLARLSQEKAKEMQIEPDMAKRLIRIDSAKTNFSLPDEDATWFRMESVQIANSEWLGVPVPVDIKQLAKPKEKGKGHGNIAMDIAECMKAKVDDKGHCKFTEIVAHYMDFTGYKRTKAIDNSKRLPRGRSKAHLVKLDTSEYRIWYEKADKQTAPIIIHIEAQT